MQKKYRIILIVVVLLLALAAFWAVSLWNKPHENIAEKPHQLSVTAKELFEAFQQNEQAANERYTGKILLINGKLNQTKTTDANKTILQLHSADDFFGVSCYMNSAHFTQAPEPGSMVTIKGKCDGYTNDVVVTQCVLVEE